MWPAGSRHGDPADAGSTEKSLSGIGLPEVPACRAGAEARFQGRIVPRLRMSKNNDRIRRREVDRPVTVQSGPASAGRRNGAGFVDTAARGPRVYGVAPGPHRRHVLTRRCEVFPRRDETHRLLVALWPGRDDVRRWCDADNGITGETESGKMAPGCAAPGSRRTPGPDAREAKTGHVASSMAPLCQIIPVRSLERGVIRPNASKYRGGAGRSLLQRGVRKTWRSRSRTFLRRVLRFTPSSSAARIWLPRVAARAAPISGPSISRSTRW